MVKIVVEKIGSGTVGVTDSRADGMAEDTFVDHAPLNSHVVNARSVVCPQANGLVIRPADRDVIEDYVKDVRIPDIEGDATRTGAGGVAGAIANSDVDVTHDDIMGVYENKRVVVHLFAGKFDPASWSGLTGDG